jgi:acetyltransferase-like isoleucine patch superfamily enzyme
MTSVLPHDWFCRELPSGLQLGPRCFLYSAFSFLHCQPSAKNVVRINNDSGIYHGTFFELGPDARVEIGSYCTLVGAILRVEREVRIGDYVFIAHEVVLSDCDGPGLPRVWPSAGLLPPGSCEPRAIRIEDDVWIGMRAVILAGVTVGTGAVIGAGAVVCEDVPPRSVVSGNPAHVVRMLTTGVSERDP